MSYCTLATMPDFRCLIYLSAASSYRNNIIKLIKVEGDKYLPLQSLAFLALVYRVLYFSVVSILPRQSDHQHRNLHPIT